MVGKQAGGKSKAGRKPSLTAEHVEMLRTITAEQPRSSLDEPPFGFAPPVDPALPAPPLTVPAAPPAGLPPGDVPPFIPPSGELPPV